MDEEFERGEGEGRGGVDDRRARTVPPATVKSRTLAIEGGAVRLADTPDADQL